MLAQGTLPITVTFPSTINANVTNSTLPVTVGNTVTTLDAPMITLLEKVYAVTGTSSQIPVADYNTLTGLKGAQIQFISANGNDRLYTRTDAIAASTLDAQTTALGIITLESLTDIQSFRFMGTVGTSIKVIFRA